HREISRCSWPMHHPAAQLGPAELRPTPETHPVEPSVIRRRAQDAKRRVIDHIWMQVTGRIENPADAGRKYEWRCLGTHVLTIPLPIRQWQAVRPEPDSVDTVAQDFALRRRVGIDEFFQPSRPVVNVVIGRRDKCVWKSSERRDDLLE